MVNVPERLVKEMVIWSTMGLYSSYKGEEREKTPWFMSWTPNDRQEELVMTLPSSISIWHHKKTHTIHNLVHAYVINKSFLSFSSQSWE